LTRIDSTPTAHASVAAFFVRSILDRCEQRGLSRQQLGAAAGGLPDLSDPETRIPFKRFSELCRVAARALDDEILGLNLGAAVKPGSFGSHGFGLMCSQDGHELLQRAMRYSSLVIDGFRNEIEKRGNFYLRYWRPRFPEHFVNDRLQDELNVSGYVTCSRLVLGRDDIDPTWVSFRHAPPSNPEHVARYHEIFRCPVRFDAVETAICFPASQLDLQVPQANPHIRRAMDDLCERLLRELQEATEPKWLTTCKQAILQSLQSEAPELDTVARTIGIPSRELRLRLRGMSLNFRDLVDDLRFGLAKAHMADSRLSLHEVAFLLAFSEQSAFHRACKRWSGITPGEYRSALQTKK
jgi:AraC-like DNA-binding protein